MTDKVYVVTRAGSYGKVGDTIELGGDLTERQKAMLKPYEKPVLEVKSDGKELEAANAKIAELEAEITKLKAKK